MEELTYNYFVPFINTEKITSGNIFLYFKNKEVFLSKMSNNNLTFISILKLSSISSLQSSLKTMELKHQYNYLKYNNTALQILLTSESTFISTSSFIPNNVLSIIIYEID